MIKINQTKFGAGVGNCFAACVCCILDIEDVESVPNFCFAADNWWEFFLNWLLEKHSMHAKYCLVSEENSQKILKGECSLDIKPPFILGGPNHDGVGHAVLYCPDGSIWNTNPTCKGITKVEDIIYLVHDELK